jgi:hypothetical protein
MAPTIALFIWLIFQPPDPLFDDFSIRPFFAHSTPNFFLVWMLDRSTHESAYTRLKSLFPLATGFMVLELDC